MAVLFKRFLGLLCLIGSLLLYTKSFIPGMIDLFGNLFGHSIKEFFILLIICIISGLYGFILFILGVTMTFAKYK